MKEVVRNLFYSLFLVSYLLSCSPKTALQIDYFGQSPVKLDPKKFASSIISLEDRWEGNASFSADGASFYFNVFTDSSKTIYQSNFKDGKWNTPRPMPELSGMNSWEPFPSWDGQRLYFVSDRSPGNPEWNGRIWFIERIGADAWSSPIHLDLNISTQHGLWFQNISKRGSLYFGGHLKVADSVGLSDLYSFNLKTREILTIPNICSAADDWDPFVAPDESFILWASDRPGGFGGMDLYVSFRSGKSQEWGPPINLGEKVNTKNYEVAPRLSPDGKFLFFDRPIAGTQDIYWVSTELIYRLRPN